MKQQFDQQFAIDTNTVLTDLWYLQCSNYDVVKFVNDFNLKLSLLPFPLDAGTELLAKQQLADGLPFHIQEYVMMSKNYPLYTLTDVQTEAGRQMAILLKLN